MVEHPLHGEDIHPALVIGQHQVPAFPLEVFGAFHIPFCTMGQLHPAGVAGNPGFRDPDDDPSTQDPEALDGDDEFENGRDVEQDAPEQGVDSQQDRIEYTDDGGREKAEHGGPVSGYCFQIGANDSNHRPHWAVA